MEALLAVLRSGDMPEGARAAAFGAFSAAVVICSATRCVRSGQCGVVALPVVLPLNAVRKVAMLAYGLMAMVVSSDKRYKLLGVSDAPHQAERLLYRKRIVFIRHGESTWNQMWNKGFMPPGFLLRVGNGFLQEVLLFATRDSVLLDSGLNSTGIAQARALAEWVARPPAGLTARQLDAVKAVRGDADARSTVRCASNLRRAISTACLACPEATADAPLEVLSSMQEISVNIDTLALTPARTDPLLASGTPMPKTWGHEDNTGNKALFGSGKGRLEEFVRWAMSRSEDVVVVGGHSLVFREFFKAYLPASSDFIGKSTKVVNCGVVAFDLDMYSDGSARVEESSIDVVYGGFEGGKKKKKKGGLKKALTAVAVSVVAGLAMRLALGPGPRAQYPLPFGM